MDKRFESLIEKMDELINQSRELQIKTSTLLKKTNETQTELDSKVSETNKVITNAIVDFKNQSNNVISEMTKLSNERMHTMDSSISDIKQELESIEKQYNENVDQLIHSIKGKSNEIFKIYDELESIRKIQITFTETLTKFTDDYNKAILKFENESKEIISNSDIGNISSIVEKLESRVKRLEQHAHRHTFGGTKI